MSAFTFPSSTLQWKISSIKSVMETEKYNELLCTHHSTSTNLNNYEFMNGLETPMQPPPAYCKANPIYITLFVNTWTCSLKYQNFF